MRKECLICACQSPEHTLQFLYIPKFKKDEPELITEVYLKPTKGFFGRLWLAIKYVFSGKVKHGHFDSFMMTHQDATKMTHVLLGFINEYQQWEEEQGIRA